MSGLHLLPPAPDKCQECAVEHAPEAPHDASSLYYQMYQKMYYNLDATWLDAMAHCDQPTKDKWIAALIERGIDVYAGKIYPSK